MDEWQEISSPVVSPTHTVIQPFTVVIKVFHTLVANTTVLHFGAAEFKKNKRNIVITVMIDKWYQCWGFGDVHFDVTQVTAQVLDDVHLLRSVIKRHRTGVVLLGPHAGVGWVYSHRRNVGEKVHNKSHSGQLHVETQGKVAQNSRRLNAVHKRPLCARDSSVCQLLTWLNKALC